MAKRKTQPQPAPAPVRIVEPRRREYRCRRINDEGRHCHRLLFIAALPIGVIIEIHCPKCGRISHIDAAWPEEPTLGAPPTCGI